VQEARADKNGEVPVGMRVTTNGQRVVTSINLRVDHKNRNDTAGKLFGNTRRDDELNVSLDTMQVHRQMELDRELITAQKIIDKYLWRDAGQDIMLLCLFKEHNGKCRKGGQRNVRRNR
jgi:hypothetical protein